MADIQVAGTVATVANEQGGLWGPHWTSPSVGYCFVLTTDETMGDMFKTTDGGDNWTAQDTSNNPVNPTGIFDHWATYWDGELPGDLGTIVHVTGVTDIGASSTARYWAYNTATDTWTSLVTCLTGGSGVVSGYAYFCLSITKAVSGRIYISLRSEATDQLRYSDDAGVNWSSGVAFDTVLEDRFYIFPSCNTDDDNDIVGVWADDSAATLYLVDYDASGAAWGTPQSLGSIALPGGGLQTTYEIGVASRHSDGHLIVAWFTARDAAGSIEVRDTNGSASLTILTDAAAITDDCYYPSIFINQANDDLYVTFTGLPDGSETLHSTTTMNYMKSVDDGANWTGPTQYTATSDDMRGTARTAMRAAGGGRFMPSWFNDDLDTVSVNNSNDVEILAVSGFAHSFGIVIGG